MLEKETKENHYLAAFKIKNKGTVAICELQEAKKIKNI